MGKPRRNETGFSTVEVVLVLVIVGLIGVVGFMVYKNQHKTKTTPLATSTSSSQTKTPAKTTVAAPATIAYTETSKTYTLNYPNDWTVKEQSNSNRMTGGDTLVDATAPVFIPANLPPGAAGKTVVYVDTFSGDMKTIFKTETYGEAVGGVKGEPYNAKALTINGYDALYHQEVVNPNTIPDQGWSSTTSYYAISHNGVAVVFSFREKFTPGKSNTSVAYDVTSDDAAFTSLVKSIKFTN
jgi:hypothetical protein